MEPVLLIDFGSTYTKVTAADVEAESLLGSAQSPTTARTDVALGLARAVEKLGISGFSRRYACSSAAGGLRMVACGLVPSLTSEAARRAALGAGAKVIKAYGYALNEDDLDEISALKPDMLLLTGGTDGGNGDVILKNAEALAALTADFPIVIAGNRSVARACRRAFSEGRRVEVVENVMPALGKLNVEPAQASIRALFLERIVAAKGLTRERGLMDGILMPTPSAVLAALKTLAEESGELMAVDLGGATTDVYSIASGNPTKPGVVLRGLPEPYAKRTVEGDIGMRYGACGVLEAAGIASLCEAAGRTEDETRAWLSKIESDPDILPESAAERDADFALAVMAVAVALSRHAGRLETVYTPMGAAYQQTGKDLTGVTRVVLTGGALIRTGRAAEIAEEGLLRARAMGALAPEKAAPIVDESYALAALGVLSSGYPEAARAILRKEYLHGA